MITRSETSKSTGYMHLKFKKKKKPNLLSIIAQKIDTKVSKDICNPKMFPMEMEIFLEYTTSFYSFPLVFIY